MGDTGSLRASAAREAVVRPLARAAERACVRPGCPAPARASLSFRYASREAWLEGLRPEPTPETYDLCQSHAARTQPPHGWELRDRRPREERTAAQEPAPRRDLGGQDTVAVLAAALRAVPSEGTEGDDGSQQAPVAPAETDPAAAAPAAPGLVRDREVDATPPPDAEPEDDPSPVLGAAREQARTTSAPSLPGLGAETSAGDASGEPPAPEPAAPEASGRLEPRPVPAARARGIAPPASRSPRVPHGTARDW